jgi:outer membrane lipoprotein-sorting protein
MFRRVLTAATLACLFAVPAAGQTVDEILARNLKAKGGLDKLKAIETVRMTGTITVGPGIEAPFTMIFKRPNRLRMDFTVQGMTITQAFDGKQGWMINPMTGNRDPQPMPPEALRAVEQQADFDGPLVDYKAKGHTVELAGQEKVDGRDAWRLKVTLHNGDVRYYDLDAESYLEVKVEGSTVVGGTRIDNEGTLGDYRPVAGVMFPHVMESGPTGSPMRQKMVVQKIEVNLPLDDGRFTMPAKQTP